MRRRTEFKRNHIIYKLFRLLCYTNDLARKSNFIRYTSNIISRLSLLFLRSHNAELASDFLWKRPRAAFGISLGVAIIVSIAVWTFNPWFMTLVRPEKRLATAVGSGFLVLLTMGVYQVLVWQTLPIILLREREEEKKKEQEFYRLARFDTLTGLHNRSAFEHHLEGAIARAKRHSTCVAVGIIDLDEFKPVNDTWGHKAGDILLKQLAQRIQSRIRDSDFLARLGGDEFIVLIEDLDPEQAVIQLKQILARLHQAVEDPFNIVSTEQALIGMTMGLALFPFDAEEPDELIRQADAAMYQAKANKVNRTQWWQLGLNSGDIARADIDLDPYGAEAADLLSHYTSTFEATAAYFVKNFYSRLPTVSGAQSILANLREAEFDALRSAQIQHLRFLMGDKTTRASLRARAFRVGEIHALVGVSAALLAQSQSFYRQFLSENISRALLLSRDRYFVLHLAEMRLQDDIEAELVAIEETKGKYFEVLSRPYPEAGQPWVDAAATELAYLAMLPGIIMCVVMRPDSSGVLQIEASSGDVAERFLKLVELAGTQPRLGDDQNIGRGLVATAWLEGTIQVASDYTSDPRTAPWHEAARAIGARSLVAIPIHNREFTAESVLVIFGAYSGQFGSFWMREFCRGLKRFWEGLRQRSQATPSLAITSHHVAAEYRRRLFEGGLTMLVQPVIDLSTGHIFKAETLARLQQKDGSFLPPSVFLPLLGQADLDRMFRLTLDLSLQTIKEWDAQGLQTDISVNLSPSSLVNPKCVDWVLQALNTHAIAPKRLTLEILESQSLPNNLTEAALTSLSCTGVKLALDDLGSGYSSLQRLAEWPFEVIKIDQGLSSRIYSKPLRIFGLLQALVQMGRDLDRTVVIEGLEKIDMIEAAVFLGATHGQGYGLARPMPVSAFPVWARSFALPIEPGRIHTALGALAYHWQFMHRENFNHPVDVDECPLTAFLAESDSVNVADAMRLHANVHAKNRLTDDERRQASQALVVWLTDRIREEGWGK